MIPLDKSGTHLAPPLIRETEVAPSHAAGMDTESDLSKYEDDKTEGISVLWIQGLERECRSRNIPVQISKVAKAKQETKIQAHALSLLISGCIFPF